MNLGIRTILLVTTTFALLSAGCTDGAELYAKSVGGSNPGDISDTFDVPSGEARMSFSVGGTGSAAVTITDADGDRVYQSTFQGQGGEAESVTRKGAAGTWSIEVDFDNWQGGFAISITEA